MLTYCVRCRKKKKENLNSKIFKTKNNRLIMQQKCPKSGIKKSSNLSNLGIKTPLSKIPLLSVLF